MYKLNFSVILIFGNIIASDNKKFFKGELNNETYRNYVDQSKSIIYKDSNIFYDSRIFYVNENGKDLFKNNVNSNYIKKINLNDNLTYFSNNSIPCIDNNIVKNTRINKENIDFYDNLIYDSTFKERLEFNKTIKSYINKRTLENNEPINLSLKYRRTEKMPTIYDIKQNICFINKINSEDNLIDFVTNLKKLVNLNSFIYIYKIIESDLMISLKNSINTSFLEKDYIMSIFSNFKTYNLDEQKIIYFINITNEILNIDNNYNEHNDKKNNYLTKIFSRSYYKNDNKKNFYNKLYRKAIILNSYVQKSNITFDDVFNITIDYINQTTDEKIKILFVFGLQSLFFNFSKHNIPRLYFVSTFLHIFNYEKNYYDIDWNERLFKILSYSYFKIKSSKYYYKILSHAFENDLTKTFSIYLAMNAEHVTVALQNYKILQSNELYLNYINYLINLTYKTKCKLFRIKI